MKDLPKFPKAIWSDEEFRLVPGWPSYCISNYGRLFRRHHQRKLIHTWIHCKVFVNNGYPKSNLCFDNTPVLIKLGVIVLIAFVGPRPVNMECCHNDGDASNNCLTNLRWDSRQNNDADRRRHNTLPLGETHGCAKLSTNQVLTIKERLANGETHRNLARQFNVAKSTITAISAGINWKHLEKIDAGTDEEGRGTDRH